MTRIAVRTPSRLHFGLLARGPGAPRQFGGVGLMIDAPGLEVSARPAADWGADGPLAGRLLQLAARVAERLAEEGSAPPPARFTVRRAPPEHVGLGTGTQLGLAVARILAASAGRPDPPVAALAGWSGRGLRSGIGLHGFARGGLVVDGGRRGAEGVPPLLAHLDVPADWSVLLVIPRRGPGLHGSDEARAFAELPPIPDALTDRLCRLVLLGLLPAVAESDLDGFGAALTELQHHVGRTFATAQGGLYAHPESQAIVDALRAEGLRGVGQSSWGPTLYGFSQAPPEPRAATLRRLADQLGPGGHAAWTTPSARGAVLEVGR